MSLPETLETLPTRPGVYLFKDAEGGILYGGKARVLRDRVRSSFQAARDLDPRRASLVSEIADLELVLTDTEMEALPGRQGISGWAFFVPSDTPRVASPMISMFRTTASWVRVSDRKASRPEDV